MSCNPCGNSFCGYPMRTAVKACAVVDIILGLLGFISTLSVVLTCSKDLGNCIQISKSESMEYYENLDKYYKVLKVLLIAQVVACGLQAVLGFVLYYAAAQKSRTLCLVWVVLTVPQLVFFILRIIEVLIVYSFMHELEQEEVSGPPIEKTWGAGGQVTPFQTGNQTQSVPQEYPGNRNGNAFQGNYPPPPKYEYPNAIPTQGFGSGQAKAVNVYRSM